MFQSFFITRVFFVGFFVRNGYRLRIGLPAWLQVCKQNVYFTVFMLGTKITIKHVYVEKTEAKSGNEFLFFWDNWLLIKSANSAIIWPRPRPISKKWPSSTEAEAEYSVDSWRVCGAAHSCSCPGPYRPADPLKIVEKVTKKNHLQRAF